MADQPDRHLRLPSSRRRAGALGVLLLVSGGAFAVHAVHAVHAANEASASQDPPSGPAPFYAQKPKWASCDFDASVSCASIDVPMDYARPDGKRIAIVISRQRASDAAHRRGVLLSNPGGPGGSGLRDTGADGKSRSWPKQRFADTPLGERYDLIGFDPRGVGRSTELSCETPDADKPIVSRPDEADFTDHTAWAKAAEKGCEQGGGEFRKFVSTRNTARDMDVIRGVLGEPKVSYVGYSYGTCLGAVYGSMFGGHLDRSVLDSSLDPDAGWRRTSMSGAVADRKNVEAWAAWAAERNSRYELGTSRSEVLATVAATSAALPDDAADDGRGERTRWPSLAETVRKTKETGKFPAPEQPPAPDAQTGTASGYLPVNQTVHCETDWPLDLDVYRQDVQRFSKLYPYGTGDCLSQGKP